jgi:hypothetical protein
MAYDPTKLQTVLRCAAHCGDAELADVAMALLRRSLTHKAPSPRALLHQLQASHGPSRPSATALLAYTA